jgi:hypothetical protein
LKKFFRTTQFFYEKNDPEYQCIAASRFGFTIHSTDRLPIPRLPGAAAYPGLLNGTVWMSDPARSLHHPTPPFFIPVVFLSAAGLVSGCGCDRVFLSE